tara:strand:+ start:230 stop:1090 length:861 start_codon:yes stop_codon:yes gene_type:complete
MKKKKGRILFTGGGGFLGRQLIPLLREEGWEVVRPRSNQVRLDYEEEVNTLFDGPSATHRYDAIIHAAIVGGRRDGDDPKSNFMSNMRMFENVFRHVNTCKVFINFDSGATLGRPSINEYAKISDLGNLIPADPYGFSKYCIAQRVLNHRKGKNLRIWGCFGPQEQPDRFFATNINNYIERKPIKIIKDRKMDFIYVDDLYKIVSYMLKMGENSLLNDINCVYQQKYMLSDIAGMINNLDTYKVDIVKEGQYVEHSYCGQATSLPLDYVGMERGIQDCYDHFLQCK